MSVEDRSLSGLLRSQPNLKIGGSKSPELPDLDCVNLVIASHPLQRFWVNTEQFCCFIAVQKRLESKFICWHGLAGRGGEPRWLGCGHDWLLSQIHNAETDFDLADMRTVMRSTVRPGTVYYVESWVGDLSNNDWCEGHSCWL